MDLHDRDHRIWEAIRLLGEMRIDPEERIALLAAILNDEDHPGDRLAAATSLGLLSQAGNMDARIALTRREAVETSRVTLSLIRAYLSYAVSPATPPE